MNRSLLVIALAAGTLVAAVAGPAAKLNIIFILSDNGSSFPPNSAMGKRFNQAANGLRGFKRELYEGGLRNAGLARWPGIVLAARVSDEPWAFWDFLPTCAELSGAKIPASFKPDGLSLVSFLKGGAAPQREYFYWELHASTAVERLEGRAQWPVETDRNL